MYKHLQYSGFDTYNRLTIAYHTLIRQGILFTIWIKPHYIEINQYIAEIFLVNIV